MMERNLPPRAIAADSRAEPCPAPNRPDETPPDPRIEDYLDHVLAPLVDAAPYAQRCEIRAELAAHLDSLAAAYCEMGTPPEEAVTRALARCGDPKRVARAWQAELDDGTAEHSTWQVMRIALLPFAAARVVLGILLAMKSVAILLVVLPLVAGILTGCLVRGRAGLGTFYAVVALTSAWDAAAWMWQRLFWSPCPIGGVTGIVLFWAPVGYVGAVVAGWGRDLGRWLRRRRALA